MPYSLVLDCFPQNGALSPEDLPGQKAPALFPRELIHKQDAALATRLHKARRTKPFTTAILQPAMSEPSRHARASQGSRRTQGSHGMGTERGGEGWLFNRGHAVSRMPGTTSSFGLDRVWR
jgi:hypothetical protein